jgi:hypothetical protein
MRRGGMAIAGTVLALAGCNRPSESAASNSGQPANAIVSEARPVNAPRAAVPPAPTPLAEPKRPIDPKSAEAAGQVTQSYGSLIEQKRWTEANALWGDAGTAQRFQSELAPFADVHLEIGKLGEMEGAAGSSYVTMPVVFYGQLKDGKASRRSADIILRQVNDVPGSTDAQRRWHIERIEWKATAA